MWPISETDSEGEDNDDLPGLQSVSDSSEELDDLPPDNTSEDELTDIPDDDTMVHMSDTETETDECPYHPIGDVLSETITWILDASDPYPGDSLCPWIPHTHSHVHRIDDDFICIEDRLQRTVASLALELA